MKRNDIRDDYPILNGNTVRLEAPAESGRVHMEGSGEIHAFVSMNAVDYREMPHDEVFIDGKAEFPIDAYIGDHLKFTADTITAFVVNWNMPERSAR